MKEIITQAENIVTKAILVISFLTLIGTGLGIIAFKNIPNWATAMVILCTVLLSVMLWLILEWDKTKILRK